jgi:hypothetical protein
VALTTAIDAVNACRLSSQQGDIIRHFVDSGIPFRTLQPLAPDWRARAQITAEDRQSVPLKLEIPFRHRDYKFTPADYAVHERHKQLLLSQGLARVARQMGGIVWRLAEGFVSDEHVLEGPSATSAEYGFGLVLKGPAGEMLCDDELLPDDLDVICGLHLVLLGMFHLPSYVRC